MALRSQGASSPTKRQRLEWRQCDLAPPELRATLAAGFAEAEASMGDGSFDGMGDVSLGHSGEVDGSSWVVTSEGTSGRVWAWPLRIASDHETPQTPGAVHAFRLPGLVPPPSVGLGGAGQAALNRVAYVPPLLALLPKRHGGQSRGLIAVTKVCSHGPLPPLSFLRPPSTLPSLTTLRFMLALTYSWSRACDDWLLPLLPPSSQSLPGGRHILLDGRGAAHGKHTSASATTN